jgi:hypothetical protein
MMKIETESNNKRIARTPLYTKFSLFFLKIPLCKRNKLKKISNGHVPEDFIVSHIITQIQQQPNFNQAIRNVNLLRSIEHYSYDTLTPHIYIIE